MAFWLWLIVSFGAIWALLYNKVSLWPTTATLAGLLGTATYFQWISTPASAVLWTLFGAYFALLHITPLRRNLFSKTLYKNFQKIMPSISDTEEAALAAGTVGWEGELFRGEPNWVSFLHRSAPQLTEEEQGFLDGPVEEACRMVDEWHITHERGDMPPELWNFLKKEGFFSLIIPKEYGGKGYSAYAHSQVLAKCSSRSMVMSPTVAVPNSLGPAELLLKYGTEEQKNHYLPRLAKGDEIPCFALTGPEAGSDAGAIPDRGVVCKGTFNGKETLGISLSWDKRYITLAPVATVLGLAFKLYDPDKLLGDTTEYGITCALIPTNTPGVEIGNRHYPLNVPFMNGPTKGKDVFIPLDYIIGGSKMAGQGWKMLVECLSVGRAISLPSSTAGFAKFATVATGAYARIRRQFKQPIGYMEGIEEALSRIAGKTYTIDAARSLSANAVDHGEKPSVPSAIVKYHATEMGREVVIDAMDVHGGKGIIMGPKNYLGRVYQGAPVGITVEGANILTRSMIIFGQGSMRCHPYLFSLVKALSAQPSDESIKAFDKLLFQHIGYTLSNLARSFFVNLTAGRLLKVPVSPAKAYYRILTQFSISYALLADMMLLITGPALKRKETLSARLGDILSDLYLGSAVLKYYYDRREPSADFPLVEWSIRDRIYHAQEAFHKVLKNIKNPFVRIPLRFFVFPYGRQFSPPSDELTHKVARLMLADNDTRARMGDGIFWSKGTGDQFDLLNQCLAKVEKVDELMKRLGTAIKESLNKPAEDFASQINWGIENKVIESSDALLLRSYENARKEIIAVDDFPHEHFNLVRFIEEERERMQKAS